MRVFEHPNVTGGFACPICGTGENKPVVLIGTAGTKEGHIMEARQYHLDCIELTSIVLPHGSEVIVQQYDPKEQA